MKKLHLTAHTHWDREWYKPFQYFRTKLVYVIDRLIDTLEADPEFRFMLDGQTIVLDDYLSIKPENFGRLRALVSSGRLAVGPWYIQPDEFAPDAESLVRNLMLGIRRAETFGGSMMVGYLPDSFGHSPQMPQILRGVGIESAVMMRGVDFDRIGKTEFSWRGLNGDEVLGIYLIKGYMNAMFLSQNSDAGRLRLHKLAEELSAHTLCDRVLIMNGVDHAFAQAQASSLAIDDARIEIGGLEEYAALAERQTAGRRPELSGELLTPRHHRVHSSIASTRIGQKADNRRLSLQLERSCEPVCTAAMLFGANYPKGLIDEAWKKLISNQTHDGICGCCTDQVHREMDQRFVEVGQICSSLVNSHGRALSAAAGVQTNDFSGLLVFNTAFRVGDRWIETEVYSAGEFRLTDENGEELDYAIISSEDVDLAGLSIWTLYMAKPQPSRRLKILFRCSFDSVFGYRYLRMEPRPEVAAVSIPNVSAAGTGFKNDYYSMMIGADGSLNLNDLESGREYRGLCVFEDCGEGGDSYNHSPLENDRIVLSTDGEVTVGKTADCPLYSEFQLSYAMQIPRSLSDDGRGRSTQTVAMPVKVRMRCYGDSRRIDFSVDIENTALSHRLRVLFPFGQSVGTSYAETQFGVTQRSTAAPVSAEDWPETPLPIYSMQRFAGLQDGSGGLFVLNRGLTEYEVYQRGGSVLALTLHRGVSMMGKPNLAIRPGRASGIEVSTPDAEAPGTLRREFALIAGRGSGAAADAAAEAAAEADFYTAPAAVFQSGLGMTPDEDEKSMLEAFSIDNLQSVICESLVKPVPAAADLLQLGSGKLSVSAVKKAADDDSVIIRLYNPGSRTVIGEVLSVGFRHTAAGITDLNERGEESLSGKKGQYLLPPVGPACQITIKISM